MAKNSFKFKMTAVSSSASYSPSFTLDRTYSYIFKYSLMRDYFASLGDSAHPDSPDPRARAITRFQELLLVSFREFSIITSETIQNERKRYRSEIIYSIETFSKRSSIRNLKSLGRFTKDQVGLVYDALYQAMCVVPPPPTSFQAPPPKKLITTADDKDAGSSEERIETRIGTGTFGVFMSEVVTWARNEKIVRNGPGFGSSNGPAVKSGVAGLAAGLGRLGLERVDREVAEHELIDRLFYFWDVNCRGALSFQVSLYHFVGLPSSNMFYFVGSGFGIGWCNVQ